ncbi:hypothetical protein NN561_017652 [Cricetulus griseus]
MADLDSHDPHHVRLRLQRPFHPSAQAPEPAPPGACAPASGAESLLPLTASVFGRHPTRFTRSPIGTHGPGSPHSVLSASPCGFPSGFKVDNRFGRTFLRSARQQMEEWSSGGGIFRLRSARSNGGSASSRGGGGKGRRQPRNCFFFLAPPSSE